LMGLGLIGIGILIPRARRLSPAPTVKER
jgi:hypothetical protein